MFDCTLTDGVATITLDRPEARNAVAVRHWRELASLSEKIVGDDARAVVIASAVPGIFSAGADMTEFAELRDDADLRPEFRAAMRQGIEAVAALPMPVLAAVDGGCFGAAVALTLACDIRIAGRDAIFATTPARLGLGYPREDVARLLALVGRGVAGRMLLAGERLDARAAKRIGLAEAADDDAVSAARALARIIADNDAGAVRLLKQTLADPDDQALDPAFDGQFGTSGFADRLDTFLNRRGGAR
ncbi:enoyl-CoA hydratase/isomerase family protein [Stakelama saccharophila]|uniref:Enoyl-CoA hydratase/isomerase family protein n=1 Tax=Stakelama saccharophila TaxID=3075605 RepID=A0ABZ0B5B0_9SPHN|nr:enoyl-CoA hydratase/isomerase family protein [Stakelama sp. W311]WNO52473.1 enoyl-CoA hydratase/isomerase family protein [Stakelama sp. W311]